MISAFIFWSSFSVIFYHYAIFILIIFVLSALRKKVILTGDDRPSVSMIIAAYNEEKVIRQKILNSLELEYPKNKIEIIVVSDGSNDRTHSIVQEYADRGVIAITDPQRKGKSMAINRGVGKAKGEILFFTDANTILDKSCLGKLVRNFHDMKVGGVSGKKVIKKSDKDRSADLGDQTYWEFESALKLKESQIDSIPTGDGEIFAIRRMLFETLPEGTINDDSAITFDIVKKGHRVIYEPEALSSEEASITLKDDFNVKARMVYGGLQIVRRYKNSLKQFKNFFVFQFISHKVLRYSMPIFLILLLVSNLFLAGSFYWIFLVAQLSFYLSALIGFRQYKKGIRNVFFYYPMYYCMVNLAALKGIIYFLRNMSPNEIWKKAVR
ncbi:MAG: glycosyltransferase family 2 protein [Bdellovibrio sp.]|nr:glycosyltransferase family 2 protein [Bdellovibrio sp.]